MLPAMCLPRHEEFFSHDRALLRARLIQSLADVPGTQLTGSWASMEAHLPPPTSSIIISLSDVDVLIDHQPSSAETLLVGQLLRSSVRTHGIKISKVSVRYRAEIEGLWNLPDVHACISDRSRAGAFLAFWTLIGAIEASGVTLTSGTPDRSYALTKLFFKLGRNVLMLKGRCASSYRELAKDVIQLSASPSAVASAFKVKVGAQPLLSQLDTDELLKEEFWLSQIRTLVNNESMELISSVLRDVWNWHQRGGHLQTERYIATCNRLTFTQPMVAAHAKTVWDHAAGRRLREIC